MGQLKIRLLKYVLTFVLVALLVLALAHGPHGGAAVGLLMSLFIGLLAGAIFMLLNFKWYWNILLGSVITALTLAALTLFLDAIPEQINEVALDCLSCTLIIVVYAGLIELVNYMGRRFAVK